MIVTGKPAQAIMPLNSAPTIELTVPVVIMAAETTLWDRNKVKMIFRWTPLKLFKITHSLKLIKLAGCVVS